MIRMIDVTYMATQGTNSVIKTRLKTKFIEVTETKTKPY